MGPLALLGALISLAELGIVPSLCDSQQSKTVCVLQFNTAASWESAPSRSFGCAQPLCDSQKNATLVAFLNTGFAVLLFESKPSGCHKAKRPSLSTEAILFIGSLAVYYSRMATATLPSSQLRFTSEFGMDSGGSTALLPPGKNCLSVFN